MAASNGNSTNEKKPLLDLDTLAPQDYVRINGETYFVVAPGSKGIWWEVQSAALFRRCREIEQLGDDMSEDDGREYDVKLRELMRMIVPDMPDAVIETMTNAHRAELVASFFVARVLSPIPPETDTPPETENGTPTPTPTQPSSPGSHASTAAGSGS